MQHEERDPEEVEGVVGDELAVLDAHVEPLAEPVHGERGEAGGPRGRCTSGSGRGRAGRCGW